MHHAIAVGKELCLGFVWGMFIVFFQIRWMQTMNSIRSRAEEIIQAEMIYV